MSRINAVVRDFLARHHPKPKPEAAKPKITWSALPGNMMEYGNTGWQIRMDLGAGPGGLDEFTSVTPEGKENYRRHGPDALEELQARVERMQAQRDEFKPELTVKNWADLFKNFGG